MFAKHLQTLDRLLLELSNSPESVILSGQRQELLFIHEQFVGQKERLFEQTDRLVARLKFFDVPEVISNLLPKLTAHIHLQGRFEEMLQNLMDQHGLATQLHDLITTHISTLRRLFEERRMIVDESSYIIETAYQTWFHETVSEQDRQQFLDTVCALQDRIRQQFPAQREAIYKIDVTSFLFIFILAVN